MSDINYLFFKAMKSNIWDSLPFLGGKETMAVELHRLVEKVSNMDVNLIAGKGGLNNLVTWVHMVETAEASNFLDGGEIAFTTGLGLGNQIDLLDLIKLMQEKEVSGLMVNTGPFIEKIPQNAIDYCNEHDFPLFVIPWKIHLAEVMRIFCFAITKDEQRILETAAAFKNAIFFPNQEELYLVPLSQRGFYTEWKYSVCMMSLSSDTTDFEGRLEKFANSLDTYAQHKYKNFAIFSNHLELLIVMGNYTEEQTRDFVWDIYSHATQIISKGESLTAGCGKLTQSIRCLWKSYNQARSIQRLQNNSKQDNPVIFYSDMGIYKLLMGIEDREIIEEYYEKTILPLIEYDNKNDSDLAIVLRSYLRHNGSVKETSDEQFVHRNTINYKLSKISEILGLDLSLLNSRLILSLGFMLEDMI